MGTRSLERKINLKLKRGLNAEELRRSLRKNKYFAGIFDYTDLPKLIVNTYPTCFIIYYNQHWLAIYISLKSLEIFDSINAIWHEPPKEFIHFLCLHSNKKLRLNKPIQSRYSNVCGLYVLFFIKMKSRGWRWKKILKFFNSKKIFNDKLMDNIFSCK